MHYIAKEDFVFIRKNVSLEQLFDVAILTGFAALFTSRLFYVLYNPSPHFLNPLAFFGLPYFPGLSVSGGLLGAALFLVIYGRSQRTLAARMSDFFSLALLFVLPISFILASFLADRAEFLLFIIAAILSLVLFFIFSKLFYPKLIGGQYKDGVIGYLFLMNFSLSFLLAHIISRASLRHFYFTTEDAVMLITFLVGVILYYRQERSSRKRVPRLQL